MVTCCVNSNKSGRTVTAEGQNTDEKHPKSIMKLALIFLSLILASPVEEKRFLEFLHLDSLVERLKIVVSNGMGYEACLPVCHQMAGLQSYLCSVACREAIAAVGK